MLNNSGESGHPCLVPDLSEKAFSFSPLSILFAVGLPEIALIMLGYVPSILTLERVFIMMDDGLCQMLFLHLLR